MSEHVPHTMRAARLAATGTPPRLEVRPVPVPTPAPGQVLVRVGAAAIHAADLRTCRGGVPLRRPLPTTPGLEGAGRVVSVGGGWMTRWLVGRRVAFLGSDTLDGAWAEYALVEASRCLPLPDTVPDVQGATLLRGAVSALATLDAVEAGPRRGLVLHGVGTPAAVSLSALAKARGIPVVHVAEDAAAATRLREQGAERVVDAGDPDVEAHVRRWSRAVEARVIVDTAGGALLGRLLAALPDGSEALLLDAEAQPVRVEAAELVLHGKRLRGLSIEDALGTRGLGAWTRPLSRQLDSVFRRPVGARVDLTALPELVALAPSDLRVEVRVLVGLGSGAGT